MISRASLHFPVLVLGILALVLSGVYALDPPSNFKATWSNETVTLTWTPPSSPVLPILSYTLNDGETTTQLENVTSTVVTVPLQTSKTFTIAARNRGGPGTPSDPISVKTYPALSFIGNDGAPWSSGSSWAGGLLPTSKDVVYLNGKRVTIDVMSATAYMIKGPGGLVCTTSGGAGDRTIVTGALQALPESNDKTISLTGTGTCVLDIQGENYSGSGSNAILSTATLGWKVNKAAGSVAFVEAGDSFRLVGFEEASLAGTIAGTGTISAGVDTAGSKSTTLILKDGFTFAGIITSAHADSTIQLEGAGHRIGTLSLTKGGASLMCTNCIASSLLTPAVPTPVTSLYAFPGSAAQIGSLNANTNILFAGEPGSAAASLIVGGSTAKSALTVSARRGTSFTLTLQGSFDADTKVTIDALGTTGTSAGQLLLGSTSSPLIVSGSFNIASPSFFPVVNPASSMVSLRTATGSLKVSGRLISSSTAADQDCSFTAHGTIELTNSASTAILTCGNALFEATSLLNTTGCSKLTFEKDPNAADAAAASSVRTFKGQFDHVNGDGSTYDFNPIFECGDTAQAAGIALTSPGTLSIVAPARFLRALPQLYATDGAKVNVDGRTIITVTRLYLARSDLRVIDADVTVKTLSHSTSSSFGNPTISLNTSTSYFHADNVPTIARPFKVFGSSPTARLQFGKANSSTTMGAEFDLQGQGAVEIIPWARVQVQSTGTSSLNDFIISGSSSSWQFSIGANAEYRVSSMSHNIKSENGATCSFTCAGTVVVDRVPDRQLMLTVGCGQTVFTETSRIDLSDCATLTISTPSDYTGVAEMKVMNGWYTQTIVTGQVCTSANGLIISKSTSNKNNVTLGSGFRMNELTRIVVEDYNLLKVTTSEAIKFPYLKIDGALQYAPATPIPSGLIIVSLTTSSSSRLSIAAGAHVVVENSIRVGGGNPLVTGAASTSILELGSGIIETSLEFIGQGTLLVARPVTFLASEVKMVLPDEWVMRVTPTGALIVKDGTLAIEGTKGSFICEGRIDLTGSKPTLALQSDEISFAPDSMVTGTNCAAVSILGASNTAALRTRKLNGSFVYYANTSMSLSSCQNEYGLVIDKATVIVAPDARLNGWSSLHIKSDADVLLQPADRITVSSLSVSGKLTLTGALATTTTRCLSGTAGRVYLSTPASKLEMGRYVHNGASGVLCSLTVDGSTESSELTVEGTFDTSGSLKFTGIGIARVAPGKTATFTRGMSIEFLPSSVWKWELPETSTMDLKPIGSSSSTFTFSGDSNVLVSLVFNGTVNLASIPGQTQMSTLVFNALNVKFTDKSKLNFIDCASVLFADPSGAAPPIPPTPRIAGTVTHAVSNASEPFTTYTCLSRKEYTGIIMQAASTLIVEQSAQFPTPLSGFSLRHKSTIVFETAPTKVFLAVIAGKVSLTQSLEIGALLDNSVPETSPQVEFVGTKENVTLTVLEEFTYAGSAFPIIARNEAQNVKVVLGARVASPPAAGDTPKMVWGGNIQVRGYGGIVVAGDVITSKSKTTEVTTGQDSKLTVEIEPTARLTIPESTFSVTGTCSLTNQGILNLRNSTSVALVKCSNADFAPDSTLLYKECGSLKFGGGAAAASTGKQYLRGKLTYTPDQAGQPPAQCPDYTKAGLVSYDTANVVVASTAKLTPYLPMLKIDGSTATVLFEKPVVSLSSSGEDEDFFDYSPLSSSTPFLPLRADAYVPTIHTVRTGNDLIAEGPLLVKQYVPESIASSLMLRGESAEVVLEAATLKLSQTTDTTPVHVDGDVAAARISISSVARNFSFTGAGTMLLPSSLNLVTTTNQPILLGLDSASAVTAAKQWAVKIPIESSLSLDKLVTIGAGKFVSQGQLSLSTPGMLKALGAVLFTNTSRTTILQNAEMSFTTKDASVSSLAGQFVVNGLLRLEGTATLFDTTGNSTYTGGGRVRCRDGVTDLGIESVKLSYDDVCRGALVTKCRYRDAHISCLYNTPLPEYLPIGCEGLNSSDILFRLSPPEASLPVGLNFTAATGRLYGTPTKEFDETQFTITPVSTRGDGESWSFNITISNHACPAGYYCPTTANVGEPCPAGNYCPANTINPRPCSPGQYCPEKTVLAAPCPAGSWCPTTSTINACATVGEYCPPGSTDHKLCPAGSYCPSVTEKSACEDGDWCPEGTVQRATCTKGYYCEHPDVRVICPLGFFCPQQSTFARPCVAPAYCPEGSDAANPCPEGFFCTDPLTKAACPVSERCPAGVMQGLACEQGEYCPGGAKGDASCPAGSYCSTVTEIADCPAGSYCTARSIQPKVCSTAKGVYCGPRTTMQDPWCPAGNRCPTNVEKFACDSGTYCPTGSTVQEDCKSGKLCVTPETQVPCPAKYYCPGKTVAGLNCPAGFACAEGSAAPAECTKGSFAVELSMICSLCELGKATNTTKSEKCTACPAGTYADEPGTEVCLSCGPGYTTAASGATSKDKCVPKGADEGDQSFFSTVLGKIIVALPSTLFSIALFFGGVWANRRRVDNSWKQYPGFWVANEVRKTLKLNISNVADARSQHYLELMGSLIVGVAAVKFPHRMPHTSGKTSDASKPSYSASLASPSSPSSSSSPSSPSSPSSTLSSSSTSSPVPPMTPGGGAAMSIDVEADMYHIVEGMDMDERKNLHNLLIAGIRATSFFPKNMCSSERPEGMLVFERAKLFGNLLPNPCCIKYMDSFDFDSILFRRAMPRIIQASIEALLPTDDAEMDRVTGSPLDPAYSSSSTVYASPPLSVNSSGRGSAGGSAGVVGVGRSTSFNKPPPYVPPTISMGPVPPLPSKSNFSSSSSSSSSSTASGTAYLVPSAPTSTARVQPTLPSRSPVPPLPPAPPAPVSATSSSNGVSTWAPAPVARPANLPAFLGPVPPPPVPGAGAGAGAGASSVPALPSRGGGTGAAPRPVAPLPPYLAAQQPPAASQARNDGPLPPYMMNSNQPR